MYILKRILQRFPKILLEANAQLFAHLCVVDIKIHDVSDHQVIAI